MKLRLVSYPSVLTYVLGTQKNHLIETVLFEYPQHMFWLRNKKIIFSYTLLSGVMQSAQTVGMFRPVNKEINIRCQNSVKDQ